MTFVDDTYSYFEKDIDLRRGTRPKSFGLGERIKKTFKGAIKRSPKDTLELFRTRLIQLRDLRTKLTMIRGVDVVNSTNRQIDSVQKSIFDLENQFIAFYSDKQGAKAVINSIAQNPDLSISDNLVAQNFLNQMTIPNVVTPVPTGVIYGTMVGGYGGGIPSYGGEGIVDATQEQQQGSEVVDKTVEPKKDNTILYLGIGIIAVILLTRK
jgi:hypothetical protein